MTEEVTWEDALERLRLTAGSRKALGRLLGLSTTQIKRWRKGENKPSKKAQARIIEVYEAMRQEARIGLGACMAAMQVLEQVMDQDSHAQCLAKAEWGREMLQKRFIGKLETLKQVNERT